jgi:hypothetical protein
MPESKEVVGSAGFSKPEPLDWTAQLVMLREMTKRFGSIHEAQALQLKLWPFTVDNTLENSNAAVDFENKHVSFEWLGSTMKIDKKYQERLETLECNVKFLLGDDWSMSVIEDGTAIFPLSDTKNHAKRKTKRIRSNKRKSIRKNNRRR